MFSWQERVTLFPEWQNSKWERQRCHWMGHLLSVMHPLCRHQQGEPNKDNFKFKSLLKGMKALRGPCQEALPWDHVERGCPELHRASIFHICSFVSWRQKPKANEPSMSWKPKGRVCPVLCRVSSSMWLASPSRAVQNEARGGTHVLLGLTANASVPSHLSNPHLYMAETGPFIGLMFTKHTWLTRQRVPRIYLSLTLLHCGFKCTLYLGSLIKILRMILRPPW